MKIVMGLGNPGPEYDATRHNVGWWAVDRLAHDWRLGSFRREGPALATGGVVEEEEVLLLKPLTYMNRSGAALRPFLGREGFAVSGDLMVVVDDATREVGRVRLRPGGSAGGHKGLKSIEAALGHTDYPRLRIGVGRPPHGADLVEWVLSPMDEQDEDEVLAILAEVPEALRTWIREGVEPAMNRINR
jgi:peptidyl-tRNA hydrolase, PTH1 family